MRLKKLIILCAVLALSGCNEVQTDTSEIQPTAESTTIQEKTDISVALVVNQMYSDFSVEEQAEKFGKSSEKYNIDISVYMDDEDYYADSAFSRFSRDMLSGNVPDVIIAPPEKARILKNNGCFTDIAPLMESYDGIEQSDLLDNVLESVSEDGEIPLIYSSFMLETAAAKTSIVGNVTDWSFEEMSAEFAELPQDDNHDFLYSLLDDGTFRRYVTLKMFSGCVYNNTCDFSEVVPYVMDFISSAKSVGARYKTLQLPDNFDNMLYDDRAVVNFFEINGINSSYTHSAYMPFHEEEFTFVGMPSMNGSGAYTTVTYMYGITETSGNREGAWEFVSSFFDTGYLTQKSLEYRGIPTTKKAVENLCSMGSYMSNSIRAPYSYPDSDEQLEITDDAVNQLAEYIGTVTLEPYTDLQIESIINEECGAVYAGERTPEECADILNNRIGIYLSEKS